MNRRKAAGTRAAMFFWSKKNIEEMFDIPALDTI